MVDFQLCNFHFFQEVCNPKLVSFDMIMIVQMNDLPKYDYFPHFHYVTYLFSHWMTQLYWGEMWNFWHMVLRNNITLQFFSTFIYLEKSLFLNLCFLSYNTMWRICSACIFMCDFFSVGTKIIFFGTQKLCETNVQIFPFW